MHLGIGSDGRFWNLVFCFWLVVARELARAIFRAEPSRPFSSFSKQAKPSRAFYGIEPDRAEPSLARLGSFPALLSLPLPSTHSVSSSANVHDLTIKATRHNSKRAEQSRGERSEVQKSVVRSGADAAATMSVREYLEKHLLSRKIEEAVNAAVRAKTPDPVLFISTHMRRAAPAVITRVRARQILDSRGAPAVEVDLHTNRAVHRSSAAGAGAPEGAAVDAARDAEKRRLLARAVADAVRVINDKVSEALVGMDPQQQAQIDQAIMDLDKVHHKAEIGANAMLAVSIAACKAGAAEKEVPLYKHIADLVGKSATTLPVPAITVINGGTHAGNSLPIQEIMILPVGAKNFEEAMQMGSETYHHLKDIILEKYGSDSCNIGEDGGFAPNISSISEGLDLVIAAIDRAGYNGRIKSAIDVAATDFCAGKKYDLEFKFAKKSGQNFKTGDDLIEMYSQLCSEYPLISIEQPFDKDDWEHSKKFTTLELCQVVGDDLLMSDPERIKRAINEFTCNALVLTPNQVGTVTEAIEVVKQAKDAHWGVMVSHRSGDTDDSFIADLAVGAAAGQIKAGAPCRGECLTKYNQLIRIEDELGSEGVYAGENWRNTVSTS